MSSPITLKQLRFFTSLASTRHFRKAAEREGVTQPSLSAQIALLEESLGLDLVERTGGVRLSPAGREIEARALRVLEEVRGLRDLAASLRMGEAGVLRVGVSLTVGPYLMPYVVRDLHRKFPGMGLFIREAAPADLEADLLRGEHDAIITQLPMRSSDLDDMAIFREPLMLVVPDDHPLAAMQRPGDRDLADQPVMILGRSYPMSNQIAALCQDLGARVLDNYEGTSLDALRQMVGMGMGVAFLPALYVESEIRGRESSVVVLPFRPGRLTRTVGIAWRKSSGRIRTIDRLARQLHDTASRRFGNLVQML